LNDIAKRLFALENTFNGSSVQTVFNEFKNRFTQLQNEVTSHNKMTDSQILSLLRKLDEIAIPPKSDVAKEISHEPANAGFVRWVFGGNAFNRKKL
jgi:predicted PolB exonuclease-like 3'-5' exonuclease